MATLFVSDLHLPEQHSATTDLFEQFLLRIAGDAEALYILGDLFEVWLGDDVSMPCYASVVQALRYTTAHDTPVYIMHGNRDFLLGEHFCRETGCEAIPDPTVITLYGKRTLLSHGDILCVDDSEYQRYRAHVRNPQWEKAFLDLSAEQRRETARRYRQQSAERNSQKPQDIMDVNPQAVTQLMQQHGVLQLIHGHTHRPAVHSLLIDALPAKRYVLGDWHQSGSVLTCTNSAWELNRVEPA